MAAGDFLSSIELISPTEFAKRKIQSLQDYSILAAESVARLASFANWDQCSPDSLSPGATLQEWRVNLAP